MAFIRAHHHLFSVTHLIVALLLSTALIVLTNGQGQLNQQDSTLVLLGGQLSGTTLEYVVNKNDERTADKVDTVTIRYIIPQNSWISIGFSDNGGAMIGSDAVIGFPNTGIVQKYSMTDIVASGVVPMPEEQQTLIDTSCTVDDDGITTLTFTKILKEDNKNEIPINIGTNTFMGAYGFDNSFFMHQARDSFTMDLVDGGVEIVEIGATTLWQAHGWFAALAWGLFAPIAIGSALLRSWFPPGPLWFQIHQYLNYGVVGFTIVSFAFGVAAIDAETPEGTNPDHFSPKPYPHKFVGLIVFLVIIFQAFGGQFRPDLPKKVDETKTTIRFAWEIFHRVAGIGLLAASWYQIQSGIRLYQQFFVDSRDVNLTGIFWGITGTISAFILLGYIIIRVNNNKKNTNPKEEENEANNNNNSDTAKEVDIENHHSHSLPEENESQQQPCNNKNPKEQENETNNNYNSDMVSLNSDMDISNDTTTSYVENNPPEANGSQPKCIDSTKVDVVENHPHPEEN